MATSSKLQDDMAAVLGVREDGKPYTVGEFARDNAAAEPYRAILRHIVERDERTQAGLVRVYRLLAVSVAVLVLQFVLTEWRYQVAKRRIDRAATEFLNHR